MRITVWMTGILAITISLMAGSRLCFAIDTPDTGYQITSTNRTIDVFSACKQVKSSSLTLFAPTKNSNEWASFRNWATDNPSKVTLDACATCSDSIQNQGETGIDCGGPCAACAAAPTCSDGIQNQGETGIDCGGPCPACGGTPTCSDGIQNQGETGIDCGGPCPACGEPCVPDPGSCDAQQGGGQNSCGLNYGHDSCGNGCSRSWNNCNTGQQCEDWECVSD